LLKPCTSATANGATTDRFIGLLLFSYPPGNAIQGFGKVSDRHRSGVVVPRRSGDAEFLSKRNFIRLTFPLHHDRKPQTLSKTNDAVALLRARGVCVERIPCRRSCALVDVLLFDGAVGLAPLRLLTWAAFMHPQAC
jgi:hypothetical protein